MSERMPPYVIEFMRATQVLCGILHVPYAQTTQHDGLYVAMRSRRDPININRKRRILTVRLRRGNVEVFRSEEAVKGFPTDHLIAQLMLVK
jgi:hypothetical protein